MFCKTSALDHLRGFRILTLESQKVMPRDLLK